MMSLVLSSVDDGQWCNLVFTRQDDGEISVCLVGEHEGKYLQVDFEDLNETDLDDFISYLQRRKRLSEKTGEGDANTA